MGLGKTAGTNTSPVQNGINSHPGWGDFAPLSHPTQEMRTPNFSSRCISSSTSSAPYHYVPQSAMFLHDGGISSSIASAPTVNSHLQSPHISINGIHSASSGNPSDGSQSGDKFGLNSSCSSDKFSILDDMVSKIVDDESNYFSLNSNSGEDYNNHSVQSQNMSDVFALEE